MSGAAIVARELRKVFADPRGGQSVAVDGVDLECRYGEVHGLLGPNGAGKTTTLRILATILAPTSGRATVDGVDVAEDPLEVRRRLGFLSSSTGLYARLTPRETLSYFGALHGIDDDLLEARIEELTRVFGLRDFADRRCEALSTGQRQRVSLARAVLHDPPVLILDEPTTGLDVFGTSDTIEFVSSRRGEGRAVLFSTHVLSEAERLCDRISILHRGRVLDTGTLDELRERTGRSYLDEVFLALVRRAQAGEPGHAPAAESA